MANGINVFFNKNGLMVLPPFWLQNETGIQQVDSDTFLKPASELQGVPHYVPLALKRQSDSGDYWKLPIDPVASVSGKNNIVKRQVLKADLKGQIRRGSVKELWTQDDYEVNIAGVLMGSSHNMPNEDIRKLRALCEAREVILIESEFLSFFGIDKIVIEDYEFPFTKGKENQMYTIKAVSDDFDVEQLLIEN
ncbi:MAG: DUF6046 domain-containing protein [Bacteroidales bacterium]|jgi:hypothetical protein|nr:DUF6046 domain-containing protein [Bacteroidales bacterium]